MFTTKLISLTVDVEDSDEAESHRLASFLDVDSQQVQVMKASFFADEDDEGNNNFGRQLREFLPALRVTGHLQENRLEKVKEKKKGKQRVCSFSDKVQSVSKRGLGGSFTRHGAAGDSKDGPEEQQWNLWKSALTKSSIPQATKPLSSRAIADEDTAAGVSRFLVKLLHRA